MRNKKTGLSLRWRSFFLAKTLEMEEVMKQVKEMGIVAVTPVYDMRATFQGCPLFFTVFPNVLKVFKVVKVL